MGAAESLKGSAAGSPVSSATAAMSSRASFSSNPLVLRLTATTGAGLMRAATSSYRRATRAGEGRGTSLKTSSYGSPAHRIRQSGQEPCMRPSVTPEYAGCPREPWPSTRMRSGEVLAASSTSCSEAPATKSETTASTQMPHPAMITPVCPYGERDLGPDLEALPREERDALRRLAHIPDGLAGKLGREPLV